MDLRYCYGVGRPNTAARWGEVAPRRAVLQNPELRRWGGVGRGDGVVGAGAMPRGT